MNQPVAPEDLPADLAVPENDLPDDLRSPASTPESREKYKNRPISTFAANALNTATFGLPDYLNETFTPEAYAEAQKYNEANPLAANLGEVAGYGAYAVPTVIAGRKLIGYGANKAKDVIADTVVDVMKRIQAQNLSLDDQIKQVKLEQEKLKLEQLKQKSSPIAPSAVSEPLPPEVGQVRPGAEGRPGPTRLESSRMAPVNPNAVPQRPAIGGPAAQEGASFIENITKKYLPEAGRAFSAAMETPVGRALGTTARVVGSAPVLGAQLALTPGSTGPMVPSVGRLRGSEINPLTRRPWTAQELAVYEKNPAVFDQQLPAPQMPR